MTKPRDVERLAEAVAEELDALGHGQPVGSITHIPRYVTGPDLAGCIRRALARLREDPSR